jgi:hypothetical protein
MKRDVPSLLRKRVRLSVNAYLNETELFWFCGIACKHTVCAGHNQPRTTGHWTKYSNAITKLLTKGLVRFSVGCFYIIPHSRIFIHRGTFGGCLPITWTTSWQCDCHSFFNLYNWYRNIKGSMLSIINALYWPYDRLVLLSEREWMCWWHHKRMDVCRNMW